MSDHQEPQRTDSLQGEILHVYDGIEEADNELPLWWLWTFFLAIIFAGCYWLYYESFHLGKGPLEAFNAARLAAMDTGEPVTEEEILAMKADASQVKEGRKSFSKTCTRCHGANAQGIIGPNLTDEHWLGGGAPLDIFNTINRGRSGKGMQAWGPTFGRGGVMQLTAYVLTIQNTNVPGKAPQGPIWTPPPPKEKPDADGTDVDAGAASGKSDGDVSDGASEKSPEAASEKSPEAASENAASGKAPEHGTQANGG